MQREPIPPKPLPLAPRDLLAAYERLAAAGDTAAALRVHQLRRQIEAAGDG